MKNIILFFLKTKKIIKDLLFVLKKNIFSNIFYIVLILKKKSLKKRIIKIFNSKKILNGPYKSIYIKSANWRADDDLPKLLGIYEKEIQNQIILLCKKIKLKYLVNFGASEGYHLISLIKKKYFQRAYAFEVDRLVKKKLIENINLNNLSKKIKVFDKANFKEVFNNLNNFELKKTLFLIDIEGGEYSLFNNKNLKNIKSSFFLIEMHRQSRYNFKFMQFLKKFFKIKLINQSERNPHEIKKLENFNDNEKWIMMSETRPFKMNWLLLYPKNVIISSLICIFINSQTLYSHEKNLEIYNFHGSDRYFPYLHKQYYYPKFIWDEFYEINKETWGDNTNGNLQLIPEKIGQVNHITGEKIKNNNIKLLPKQMIWSLQRHNYGQVEFRSIEFTSSFTDEVSEEKFWGFGDPGEGYAAGFNITKTNNTNNVLELLVVNHNIRRSKLIKWDPKYNGARFIINWTKNEINFIIILLDATETLLAGQFKNQNIDNNIKKKSLPPNIYDVEFTIPNIGMEISVHNYAGSDLILKHVKYDAINF